MYQVLWMVFAMAFATFATFANGATFREASGRFAFEFDSGTWAIADQKSESDVDKRLIKNIVASLTRKEGFEKYHPRFSVVIEDASKFKTGKPEGLNDYRKYVVGFLESQRFQIVGKAVVRIKGREAYQITAHQRDFGLTIRQTAVVDGKSAYLLTGSSRISRFDSEKSEIDAITETFEITKSN